MIPVEVDRLYSSVRSPPAIYGIRNDERGVVYVGQSINPLLRLAHHVSQLRRNHHMNRLLQWDWLLYGQGAFSYWLIEDCPVVKLNERERYWIGRFLADRRCYNIRVRNRARLPAAAQPDTNIIQPIGLDASPGNPTPRLLGTPKAGELGLRPAVIP